MPAPVQASTALTTQREGTADGERARAVESAGCREDHDRVLHFLHRYPLEENHLPGKLTARQIAVLMRMVDDGSVEATGDAPFRTFTLTHKEK
jgi:hypothetical protein